MLRTAIVVITLFTAGLGCHAQDRGGPWEINGQIVDEQGMPVDDFVAASFWSSNGIQWDEAGELIKVRGLAEIDKMWKEEGVLDAFPKFVAKVVGEGKFRLAVNDRPRVSVFATDKRQTRGGFVSVEKSAADKPVTITLHPLVRVHGKVYCPEAGRVPDWTMAIVHPPGDRENYLHFTHCGSVRGEFSFLLPPGKYDLAVHSSSPSARMPKPHERDKKDVPDDMPPYLGGIRIDVPSGDSLDLGVLNVLLPKDKDGIARDVSQFYGKAPPELEITDAVGVKNTVKLADYRGKWVVIDFWALWCGPCIHHSLPELTKLYEQHAADRDRFEILSICNTAQEKARTADEYSALAAPIVKKTWAGKPLPFPVLIDGDGKTSAMYGIQAWPTVLLIDPDGNLIKNGDVVMLEDKLGEPKR